MSANALRCEDKLWSNSADAKGIMLSPNSAIAAPRSEGHINIGSQIYVLCIFSFFFFFTFPLFHDAFYTFKQGLELRLKCIQLVFLGCEPLIHFNEFWKWVASCIGYGFSKWSHQPDFRLLGLCAFLTFLYIRVIAKACIFAGSYGNHSPRRWMTRSQGIL